MLAPLLRLVEEAYPSHVAEVPEGRWLEKRPVFCEQLWHLAQQILETTLLTLPRTVLKDAKQELLVSGSPGVEICEFRIRPASKYYEQTKSEIPAPESPNGPHAAGVQIGLSLCRGYDGRGVTRLPWLGMEFEVWGHRERAAFGNLLQDYRRPVQRIIEEHDLEFFSSCVSDNVEQYKGRDQFKILDLYYGNDRDPENMFKLGKTFGPQASLAQLTSTLRGLIVLYASSFGYCAKTKDRDLMFSLFAPARA
jgi:hypothetical protein